MATTGQRFVVDDADVSVGSVGLIGTITVPRTV
jgi:hypothetical protein